MSASCSGNCSACQKSCADRTERSLIEPMNPSSSADKVIAVVSGKGGVGKTIVTGMLSVLMQRRGYKIGVLDADITGPSVPKIFGLKGRAEGDSLGMYPVKSKMDIEIMSLNLLLDEVTSPVIWRGPIIAGTVKQFWTDVVWGNLDYMFIDMPPGTGDVPLTVFQSIPVDGIIIVTSPQDLVSMVVEKALMMARRMKIPVIGLVENFSYFECPDCKTKFEIFGKSKVGETAQKYGVPVLARVPIDMQLSKVCDMGCMELFEGDYLDKAADAVEDFEKKEKQ